jgi:hypothetical protein
MSKHYLLIIYDTKKVNLDQDGDLFGYLENELNNAKIVCRMSEYLHDPRAARINNRIQRSTG